MSATTTPECAAPSSPSGYTGTLHCGKGALIGRTLDALTFKVVPLTCKSWSCPRCGPRKREHWANRIKAGKPDRLITLTTNPNNFTNPWSAFYAVKEALPRLVKLIRKTFSAFSYVAAYELTKAGWPHVHILQRGSYIPQRWLSRAWNALGIGCIVDIRAVPNRNTAAHYVVKYLLKNAHETAEMIPGSRIITMSRDFLPEPPEAPPATDADFVTWSYVPIAADNVVYYLQHEFGFELSEVTDDGGTILKVRQHWTPGPCLSNDAKMLADACMT